jgi:chaperonin cofactor prefoldin
MINNNSTLVNKHQLLDYVSKREFGDFVDEMRDFRTVTESRFDSIESRLSAHDKRFDKIDRQIDELKEIIRIQTGAILDQFREDLKIGIEYFQNIDKNKVDKVEFEKLKIEIDRRFFSKEKTKEA